MAVSQTDLGKAFEYACVDALYRRYKDVQAVEIEETPQMRTARTKYETVGQKKQDLAEAADAAVRIIERLEPRLQYPGTDVPLILAVQTDSQGMAGDVRDVLCIRRKNKWQIGLSCKHNHHAVKHSRLSGTIDFGKEWFGIPCSRTYFTEVVPIFEQLRKMRDESKNAGRPMLWNELPNKFTDYYVPILRSFMKELKKLNDENTDIPTRLIHYLIGRYDFYKVITDDAHRTTRIEAINIAGTLNKNSGIYKPVTDIPVLKLPTAFYHIDFKPDSQNTIIVVCNNGWEISMRLHNASSRIEPSLKFDVQLISLPGSIHAQVEPWDMIQYPINFSDKVLKVAEK